MSELWNNIIQSESWQFLFQVAAGGGAGYFAAVCRDKQKEKRQKKDAKRQFIEVQQNMPELILGFQKILDRDKNSREFLAYILDDGIISAPGFREHIYYTKEPDKLSSCVIILENNDFIQHIHQNKYALNEPFVKFLLFKH